jgi:phosphatidate cytidylyltransferase
VLSALVIVPVLGAVIWFAPPLLLRVVILLVAALAINEMRPLVPGAGMQAAAAVFWIVIPLMLLAEIRDHQGPALVAELAAILIVSDSAQYFAGRTFGKHKLAPSISPSKTIEGAVGGLIAATVVAVPIGRLLGLAPALDWLVAVMAALTAVAGMIGDLFESFLKRRAGVKDSGNVIPGHGGVLDRIDSWLFATPVFWLCLMSRVWFR